MEKKRWRMRRGKMWLRTDGKGELENEERKDVVEDRWKIRAGG